MLKLILLQGNLIANEIFPFLGFTKGIILYNYILITFGVFLIIKSTHQEQFNKIVKKP
jgi:hypothetical protein